MITLDHPAASKAVNYKYPERRNSTTLCGAVPTMIYQRLFALVLLCIPGAIGIYGWKWMRDVFFDYMGGEGFNILSFAGGLAMFLISFLTFLGGFLYYRDEKKNLIQPKLRRKSSLKEEEA